MKARARHVTRRYAETLRRYARDEQEATLAEAYELGRAAIGAGLGVLDMARIHQRAVATWRWSRGNPGADARTREVVDTFFLEALSPFEVTHRGFQKTTVRLRQLNATLEARNRELEAEIADRKRTKSALEASEAQLQAILDYSPAVVFTKDVRGRYLLVNRRFERLFRLRQAQVVGRTDEELFAPSQAVAFRTNDHEVLRAGVPLTFEETARYHDGLHTSIVSKFPLRNAKGRIYALCGIATDITARKQAENALREREEHYRQLFNEAQAMQERLRNLSSRILHVQEEERKRISRELHDEVGQALTAISVTFATLAKNGAGSSRLKRQQLVNAQQLLEETMERVHLFARELRPAMLDELGLLPALRSCLKGFAERTGLRVQFRGDSPAERLTAEQKTALFRVAQESLTNVAKHARASRVDVSIRKVRDSIHMEVVDNGRSFRPKPQIPASGRNGLGLLGMQERVRLVQGQLTIVPQPGRGTAIRVVLPFHPATAKQQKLAGSPSNGCGRPRVLRRGAEPAGAP